MVAKKETLKGKTDHYKPHLNDEVLAIIFKELFSIREKLGKLEGELKTLKEFIKVEASHAN